MIKGFLCTEEEYLEYNFFHGKVFVIFLKLLYYSLQTITANLDFGTLERILVSLESWAIKMQ